MAIDPTVLVRAGGSFLLAPVGIAAILLAKGNRGALALGSLLVVQGIYWVDIEREARLARGA